MESGHVCIGHRQKLKDYGMNFQINSENHEGKDVKSQSPKLKTAFYPQAFVFGV